jgi:hypothetical protein
METTMDLEVRSMIGIPIPPVNPAVDGGSGGFGGLVALIAVLLMGLVLIGFVLRDSFKNRESGAEPVEHEALPRAA